MKSRRAISALVAFPPRRLPGSPPLGVGRRASPSVVIDDRGRFVPQLRRRIRVLRVVSRYLVVLTHVMIGRRARSHGERVDRDRLRTMGLRRLGWGLCPPTLGWGLVLGWRRNVPGGRGWRRLLLWWRLRLLAWDGGKLWEISPCLALVLPVRTT